MNRDGPTFVSTSLVRGISTLFSDDIPEFAGIVILSFRYIFKHKIIIY